MSTLAKKSKFTKIALEANIEKVCKLLNSRKCKTPVEGVRVALNLHHHPIQTASGIWLNPGEAAEPKHLVMNADQAQFLINDLVNKYDVVDPNAIRDFIRHNWTQFKPASATAPNGKYYTPAHMTDLFRSVLNPLLMEFPDAVILDPAAGHGALVTTVEGRTTIAADIDADAVQVMQDMGVANTLLTNSLVGVCRAKFGIANGAELIVIGNPPFNDGTSQHKRAVKAEAGTPVSCDADLQSRDTGVAFLRAAAKLGADVIVMMHPASYLIKETNFDRLGDFSTKYALQSALLVSSGEFALAGTDFPILIAVYRKGSMSFADIQAFEFPIYKNVDDTMMDSGQRLKLDRIETTQGFIRSTIPTKGMAKTSSLDLYQYNFRDTNFVLSSGNLTGTQSDSTIPVELPTLGQYAYINCYKRYFKSDFVTGNLSPLVRKADFADQDFADACIYDAVMCNQRLTTFDRTNPQAMVLTAKVLANAISNAKAFKGSGIDLHDAFVNFWNTGNDGDALAPFFLGYFATLKAASLTHAMTSTTNNATAAAVVV